MDPDADGFVNFEKFSFWWNASGGAYTPAESPAPPLLPPLLLRSFCSVGNRSLTSALKPH